MTVLFQHYENSDPQWKPPTFKECAEKDIDLVFFEENEHAATHKIDGKESLVIFEDSTLKVRSSHWEAGAKQNFDKGLYSSLATLYIKVSDYGPKPQIGKRLVMDGGTDHQRTYTIKSCEDEDGIYRMKLERVQQGGSR